MTPATHAPRTGNHGRNLLILLATLIVCRLAMMVLLPHQDPSEARYAEISRKMAETGNWITPQHLYGVPFWAKPPLSMWMSALGMKVFGVNEFGSRIMIFAGAGALVWLVARFAAREWSAAAGKAAAVVLLGMPLFFYCSAAVMTDMALALGVTLAMISFRRAVMGDGGLWGHGFFAALAIGLLAKGPLVMVMVVPPLLAWALVARRIPQVWKNLPWPTGTALMLALAAPWYMLAEQRTPGFLDYFILGEHWHRFFTKGWEGDLYGSAHAVMPGTIWFFALAGTFPWCLGLLAAPLRNWKGFPAWAGRNEGLGWFLIFWALWPLVFFTPARNAIATYPLPALPAAALLLAEIFHHHLRQPGRRRFHPLHPALPALCLAMVAWAFTATILLPQYSPKRSERALVREYAARAAPGDELIFYGRRKYSAEFYTRGKALNTRSPEVLEAHLARQSTLYAAMGEKSFASLPEPLRSRFSRIASFPGGTSLFREIPPSSLASSRTSPPSS